MPASKAQQAITADRRSKALALRVAGATLEQIAEQLGYADRQSAGKDIDRALAANTGQVADAAAERRPLEAERLDAMERAAWAVLRRPHTLVSQGRVMKDDAGRPMVDDGPILDAIDRLLKIQARRARLFGLDAPVKVQQEVRHVDSFDADIAALVADLARRGEGPAEGHPEVRAVADQGPA